ncbi:sodium/iodide cotransporter-like [Pomacea canaliculata]|uniref:sodium/iodide cotransporter-like n=1 Tax=Pomacea canaliculata TaxID=400727 RepID=UPI000D7388E5|nr:sodium/iodide cotransporter-like [Pomacea canaliculata]
MDWSLDWHDVDDCIHGTGFVSSSTGHKGSHRDPHLDVCHCVSAIGTVYTTVGGMKSVLWTDVFQTVIIFAGLIAVIVKGVMEIGGVHELYTISQRGKRLEFHEVSPDPRVRHTLWGFLFGYTLYWLACNLNQSSVQRISSTKSLRHAKLAFLAALPMNICYATCQVTAGLCMYAFFVYTGCDPLRARHVTSSNQVIIYYVVNVLGFLPGFSGLYLATLLSGSLSTLSSGLNSLAANTTEDLLRRPLSKLSPAYVTKVTKIIALLFGFVVTGVAYTFRSLEGPVTQLTTTALGASSGPVTGLFIMGFVFPQANKFGAITGSVVALTFNMWMSIGSFMYGTCKPKKPAGPLYGCPEYNNSLAFSICKQLWSSPEILEFLWQRVSHFSRHVL